MNYRSVPALLLILTVSACGSAPTAATQTPPATSGTSIGPTGGPVLSADGRARLDVPPGALTSPVAITLEPRAAVPLDPAMVGASAYAILPAAVSFLAPARMQIAYQPNLRPSGSAESELRLHHLVDDVWTPDPAAPEVDADGNLVAAAVSAGGTYGVRWSDPAGPCDLPEDRHFDFWLGEWTFAQTVPVTSGGVNSITRDAAGCRILEHFNGGRGRSVSFFSRVDLRWHQTYVDTDGNRIVMAGGFDGARMTLYSSANGRWTWERSAVGEIRYFGEALTGDTWTVTFDSRYLAR